MVYTNMNMKKNKQEQIDLLRREQSVVKGMEWFRLEEEIQELLDEKEK